MRPASSPAMAMRCTCTRARAWSATCSGRATSQPFYVNSPFGIVLAHNGNLTNTDALREELSKLDFRHLNTNSDTEVLLNIFAFELERAIRVQPMGPQAIFAAVSGVHEREGILH